MDDAGQKLKQARERLGLRYRDVEEFSARIADRHRNGEFTIAISRLSDIENRGVVPNIYKLYSLCTIYRLDLKDVLCWYGVDLGGLPGDLTLVGPDKTHLVGWTPDGLSMASQAHVQVPISLDPGVDLKRTTFLSRYIQSWGMLPVMLLAGLDLHGHSYGFVGMDDWFMYPLLQPGSLLLIDESSNKVAQTGWTSEAERPIYFLETRQGWLCCWCSLEGERLIAIPHPASQCAPVVYRHGEEAEVLGRVTGVANRFAGGVRPRTRS
ncbi:MAG: hypothetical protein C0504_03555 [Candidatus Solibacter sp.]|nr:hypothetical protein [Candidatus Solibacter sp.]